MLTIGIDEVGRGCWAGPLVAGAVLLREPVPGLRDSKKLSKSQREKLAAVIEKEAVAYGLGWVWPEDIDNWGITTAVKRAMERAVAALTESLEASTSFEAATGRSIDLSKVEVVIDGNINYLPGIATARALVRADDTVPAVSAASILAKVARDNYMATVAHGQFPLYGFAEHVGYGTAKHVAALTAHGVTILHRKSYKPIQKMLLLSEL